MADYLLYGFAQSGNSYKPALCLELAGADWSPQEHAGHLWDLEDLVHQRLDDLDAGRDVLTAADLSNRRTWEAEHNRRALTEVLGDFAAARALTIERLEAMDLGAAGRVALHPRLQVPMNVMDLALFFAEHDDHHLAQISVLLR